MSPAVWAGLGSLRSLSPLAGSMFGVTDLRHGCVKLEGPAQALVLPLDPVRARAVLEPVGLVPVLFDGVAWLSLSVERHLLNQDETYAEFYTTVAGVRADGASADLHHRFDFSVTRDAGVIALWQALWQHQFHLGTVSWSLPESHVADREPSTVEVVLRGQPLVTMRRGPRPMSAFTPENHSGWFGFVPSGVGAPRYGRGWMDAWSYVTPWDASLDHLELGGDLAAYAREAGWTGTPARWVWYPHVRTRTYFS